VAAALLLRLRPQAPEHRAGIPVDDERTIIDSLTAADARRDRASTLLWVERLGRLRPLDRAVLFARGTAWSDYAVDERPGRVFARPALRTSLERMECRRRAVGLMDSSAQLARGPADWLASRERLAELYVNLGLPGDALIAYQTIQRRMPDQSGPAMRVYRLRARLNDPEDPDTSAYHERPR
jgi:hypothetical protein